MWLHICTWLPNTITQTHKLVTVMCVYVCTRKVDLEGCYIDNIQSQSSWPPSHLSSQHFFSRLKKKQPKKIDTSHCCIISFWATTKNVQFLQKKSQVQLVLPHSTSAALQWQGDVLAKVGSQQNSFTIKLANIHMFQPKGPSLGWFIIPQCDGLCEGARWRL